MIDSIIKTRNSEQKFVKIKEKHSSKPANNLAIRVSILNASPINMNKLKNKE